MNDRKCTECQQVKALTDFGRNANGPGGLMWKCKECLNSGRRARRQTDPDRFREYNRKYRRKCSPEEQRFRTLKHKYKLTASDFTALWDKQEGLCLLCRKALELRGGGFAVDHDHSCCPGSRSCGQCVRGLLCHECNAGLGYFRDNPGLLRQAADYIEQFSKRIR